MLRFLVYGPFSPPIHTDRLDRHPYRYTENQFEKPALALNVGMIYILYIFLLKVMAFSGIDGAVKGLFTNSEYITFFSCPKKRNIFYRRSISIKQL